MKHYVHQFGRWQKHAKYANGQPDPNAVPRKAIDDLGLEDCVKLAKRCNPTRKEGHETYENSNNCFFCSVAYELQRRGVDAKAALRVLEDSDYDEAWMLKLFPNADDAVTTHTTLFKNKFVSNKLNLIGALEHQTYCKQWFDDMPDNSRGYISITWRAFYGSHAVNWEKRNGQVYVVDPQIGGAVETLEDFVKLGRGFTMFRLDNVEPDMDLILKDKVVYL